MLQVDNRAMVRTEWFRPGLSYLVEAFPDRGGSYSLSGYSADGVCIFLSMQPDSLTLPAQPQAAAFFARIIDRLEAGAVVFPMEMSAADDRELIQRLASVFVEVVIGDDWRGFPLLVASGKASEVAEVWVSQGVCDLALGRWEQWRADGPPAAPALDEGALAWYSTAESCATA